MLDQAAYTPIEAYNPAHVIAAVNALQPLGKEDVLQRIASWLGSHGGVRYPYGLLWILRALFDLPVGTAFPPLVLGTPNVPPPSDPATLPRYPILILRDIPFLVVVGYLLRGLPEPVEAHVEFFMAHGTIRRQQLRPVSTDGLENEFGLLWQHAYPGADPSLPLQTIHAQIARMKS